MDRPKAHPFRDVRLHVVTGKGGTGKSTVAGALAIALASGGRRVLLTEVEDRQGIAQLFDSPPLPYEERKVASAPGGGEVYALAIDPEDALLDYLEMFYGMKRAGRALKRFGVVDFATTIAPGMRDVLLTGKVKEAVTRNPKKDKNKLLYDAVVMDAPPTGRITRFLNVTAEVRELAKSGPVRGQAESVVALLKSKQTAVHVVTILEEMPVQETVDAVAELRAADLPVGAVIVNMARTPLLDAASQKKALAGKLDAAQIAAGLKRASFKVTDDQVTAMIRETREHAERVALEARERSDLGELGSLVCELPLLGDAVDLGGLYRLAESLRAQGVAG
ncbi:MAG: arsenite efflux ATP-binding protein ArsA [Mycobacterium sp.]|nr:arsenite efflux ATP-binding protein ArsA [Mycobacterium sp.]